MSALSLYEKIWNRHLVKQAQSKDNSSLPYPILYIDRHYIHEVTSPQAFEGLRLSNRKVHKPNLTVATMDHNVSTRSREWDACGELSALQMKTLIKNCNENDIRIYDLKHPDNGIVHIIGPELGLSLPGMTIVCGDSHTSTHGAFGILAFGIGTSEVEHVLATQTLAQQKSKTMLIEIQGELNKKISAKDVILYIIGKIGTKAGQGYVIEYTGPCIKSFSMEERMTICNMSIEAGARAGLIAPDELTFEYLKDRDFSPKGEDFTRAVADWKTLYSDSGVVFDKTVVLQAKDIEPQVTWGTNPAQVTSINSNIPKLEDFESKTQREDTRLALEYMGLAPGTAMRDVKIDRVFIGSCTNGRIDDLRKAAAVIQSHPERKVHKDVLAIVVPGSGRIRRQAEQEGLHEIFKSAGFEWRQPGCSMCLGMNDDILNPKERCASTSNRNFEGRQGRGGRTHLLSPEMAVGAALEGSLIDIRTYN